MSHSRQVAFYTIAIFLLSFVALTWHIYANGIAEPYLDPIAQIRAQDEAPIVNSVLHMAQHGDWMTPHVAGRLFLFKPPLLIWLTALSVRAIGIGLLAIRLPSLLLGAAGVAAIFAWTAHARSKTAALLAAAVLLSSPFWQNFSRLCLTDIPSASCAALALACVAFDPQLLKRRTRFLFAILASCSILAKSVAGVLPFAALFLFVLITPSRPKITALVELAIISILVLAPWYIYQIRVHSQWFFAENIQGQLLSTGVHWDRNSVIRSLPIVYYLQRILQMDPLILVLAALGLSGALKVRQQPAALLAVCWATIAIAALCAFQAASLPYLVLVIPAICVAGAICAPKFIDRTALILPVIAAIFLVKAQATGKPWSMRPSILPIPGVESMQAYYYLDRANPLISVDPDDQFYSLTIPLPHVQYCVLDPSGILPKFVPHFAKLGILVTSGQFLNLATLKPQFKSRLHEWGVDSDEPIASTITMNSPAELSAIVAASPDTDFYLPTRWLDQIADPEKTHRLLRHSPDRVFLLARQTKLRETPATQLPW